MNEIGMLNIVLIALLFIVLIVLIVIVMKLKKDDVVSTHHLIRSDNNGSITIEDLLAIVANRKSSKNDIEAASVKFIRDFPFPQKPQAQAPEDAKIYLNFVLLVASHKNSNAKLIAYINKELKKRNPAYSKEIDIYEDRGIDERKNRI